MQISNRLTAVASFITKGNRVADIGTDHGFVPIYLLENGISPKVYAMDVNKGPLERANDHIKESGYLDNSKISTRLSNGLEKLEIGEADSIIIAGMGGLLTIQILSNGMKVAKSLQELILQPQSEIEKVREFLDKEGFSIVDEEMILEEGKFYPILKVVPRVSILEETVNETLKEDSEADKVLFYRYGKQLLQKKHPVLFHFISRESEKTQELLSNIESLLQQDQVEKPHLISRKEELISDLTYMKQALKFF